MRKYDSRRIRWTPELASSLRASAHYHRFTWVLMAIVQEREAKTKGQSRVEGRVRDACMKPGSVKEQSPQWMNKKTNVTHGSKDACLNFPSR